MANCQNNMYYPRRSMQSAQTAQGPRGRNTGGCPDTHDHFPADMPIAMAYVPWQRWRELYEPRKGLESGTIFRELDKPFLGKGGARR